MLKSKERALALEKGEQFFHVNKPCSQGHTSKRYTSTGRCVECNEIRCRVSHEANKEERNQKCMDRYYADHENQLNLRAEWRAKNPDYMKEYNPKYIEKNKEKLNEYGRIYRVTYPERVKESKDKEYRKNTAGYTNRARQRESDIKMATPPWVSYKDLQPAYTERDILTKLTGVRHAVDHILPVNNKDICGLNVLWNLRPIPSRENSSKHNKFNSEQAEKMYDHLIGVSFKKG